MSLFVSEQGSAQEVFELAPDVKLELGLTTVAFGSSFWSRDGQSLNPNNMLAQLPIARGDVLARPKLSVTSDTLHAWVNPRVGYFLDRINGDVSTQENLYVQDWGLEFSPTSDWQFRMGRSLLFWGPSLFASPSNPFFTSVNQVNPFIEPGAREFVTMLYAPNNDIAVSAIANVGLGRDSNEYEEFKPIFALKLDGNTESLAVSGIGAFRPGMAHFGATAQWTATDSLIMYADGGIRTRTDGLLPTRSENDLSWTLMTRPERFEYDALVGAAYTFDGGVTATFEYRRNRQGLNSDQSRDFWSLVGDARGLLDGPTAELGALSLAQASDLHTRSLRQNYVDVQLMVRDVVEGLQLNGLVLLGIDDGSAQLIGVANYYATDDVALSVFAISNVGRLDTEFRRFFDYAGFIGLKYFSL